MAYKQKSSGLPFKELGSSPAKQKTAETDATSVAKPISPKVTGDTNQQYAEDFFGKPVERNYSKKKGKLAKDTIKKKGKMNATITKKLKAAPKPKETDAERNKRLASSYKTPAGAR
tara:strand:- start:284 stop:631 length:348 start_codon:yes stop_codon:yes gene_type:complete